MTLRRVYVRVVPDTLFVRLVRSHLCRETTIHISAITLAIRASVSLIKRQSRCQNCRKARYFHRIHRLWRCALGDFTDCLSSPSLPYITESVWHRHMQSHIGAPCQLEVVTVLHYHATCPKRALRGAVQYIEPRKMGLPQGDEVSKSFRNNSVFHGEKRLKLPRYFMPTD